MFYNKQILKELQRMDQAITDLTNSVNAAIAEIQSLVTQLQTALSTSAVADDAQVEQLVTQLNAAVTAAQAALQPPTPTASTPSA